MPKIFIVTYRGKPAKLPLLYKLENSLQPYDNQLRMPDDYEAKNYIAASTRNGAESMYAMHFGLDWHKRPYAVDVTKFNTKRG